MIVFENRDEYSLDFLHWKRNRVKVVVKESNTTIIVRKFTRKYIPNSAIYVNGDMKGLLDLRKGEVYNIKIPKEKDKYATAKKLLSKREAKEFLDIAPHKWSWDKGFANADLQCGVCGEWMSNPSNGRVIDQGLIKADDLSMTNKNITFFEGHVYEKLDWRQWYIKTFFNRKEFEEKSNYYREHGGISERLKEWRDFDDTWNKAFKDTTKENILAPNRTAAGWRDSNGEVHYFERPPVIGSYEKVYTGGWMTTPNPKTVECPCCERMYEVYALGYFKPLHLRIKERLHMFIYSLYIFKRKFYKKLKNTK